VRLTFDERDSRQSFIEGESVAFRCPISTQLEPVPLAPPAHINAHWSSTHACMSRIRIAASRASLLRRAWLNSFPQRVAAGVRSDQIGYSEYSGRIRTCVASPRLTSPRFALPRLASSRLASVEGHYLLPASVPDGRPAIQIPPPAHQDLWIYVHFDKAAIKRWQAPSLRRPQRVMCHVSRPASGCISPSIIEHPLRAELILASERSNYWEALSLHIASQS